MLWTLSQRQNTRQTRYTRCRLISLPLVVGRKTFGVNSGNPSETRGFLNSDCMSWRRSGFFEHGLMTAAIVFYSEVRRCQPDKFEICAYVLNCLLACSCTCKCDHLTKLSNHVRSRTITWLLNYSNCFLKGWFPKMTRNHILSLNYQLLPPLYVTLSEKYTIKKIQHFKRIVWH